MTQVFLEDGTAVPVTGPGQGPCRVLQVLSKDRDGLTQAVSVRVSRQTSRSRSRSERGSSRQRSKASESKTRAAAGVELLEADAEPQQLLIPEFRDNVAGR